jgi:NAD+ kinase
VSLIRRQHSRVAELAYSLGGKEVGHVRCDGLVAATPAGSTGYNLANSGPILAWGVEGYVVSFIAPHTLTARPLVVAPHDVLSVTNAPDRDPVEVVLDGEPAGELASGAEMEVSFRDAVGRLAQLPGTNFYQRIRDKFGRLAH